MNYILFDDHIRDNLLPLTFTRPTALIRIGIDTIREKWEDFLAAKVSFLTQDYLSEKYPLITEDENILINGRLIPDKNLVNFIKNLKKNEAIIIEEEILALKLSEENVKNAFTSNDLKTVKYKNDYTTINNPWDIFSLNGVILTSDFERITNNRKSGILSKTVNIIGDKENIFVEEGAKLEFVTLNVSTGPIYIGKDAEIMENAVIRGPFALCECSTIKLGAKIYGPTTIGPHCKAGGEINNSVFFGYSNKGHDGFLGNSVLGEWCNIGADSNNSNLKNNYANVRLWSYNTEKFEDTGLQFCGLIMGDHSKCGINTMFNTGTVVGINTNIFGTGFPRNFVPSFSWGGTAGFSIYQKNKAFEVAEKVMARRDIKFDNVEKNILTKVFELTEKYRNF